MEEFFRGNGKIKLITSVQINEDDIEAIRKGLEKRELIEIKLGKIIESEFTSFLGGGAEILSQLLETGRMDIKIATPQNGVGIYHEKVGIFLDNDDYVAFFGSANETMRGLTFNYECIDVYTSWDDSKRAKSKKEHFEKLWNGVQEGIDVFQFSDVLKKKLIKKISENSDSGEYRPEQEINRWRHQKEAIDIFLEKKHGILEMATGTGKSRTALDICVKLLAQEAILSIVISADGTDLLNQWFKNILEHRKYFSKKIAILRHYDKYHENERFMYVFSQSETLKV